MTRDSWILWLGIGAGLVTYLIAQGTPPTEWAYGDWLQFAGAVLATVSGKLATSPLHGKRDL